MTPSSDQSLEKAGAFVSERPRPLQLFSPLHISAPVNQAIPSTNALLSNSRATSTPTGAGSSFATDNFYNALSAARESSSVSRSKTASLSAYTDGLRVVRPSDATSGRDLASRYNRSSTPAWSPPGPIASLAHTSSAIRTTSLSSAIDSSKNASASFIYIAAASGTGESPRLVGSLGSIENRTENRSRLHPWLGPRPLDVRPVYLPLSRSATGSYATPGALIQKLPLATAIRSDRISSTKDLLGPSRTGATSALRNDLESMNKNRTESRKSERLKAHKPSVGLSPFGFNASTINRTGYYLGATPGGHYPTSCSGHVTSTAHVVYEVVTSTVLVNETIMLGPNTTTPLPVFVTPPPACQTITAPCEGAHCPSTRPPNSRRPDVDPKIPHLPPYTPLTSISTLLVTKKTPAIVQQLSAVGNLFGPSTPTPQAVAAQPNLDGQQAAGQGSGSSNPDMSTQSDDSSPSESDSDGQSPKNSTPQQNPTNDNSPSASSNSQNSNSQKPGAGSSGAQSTGSADRTASNGDQPNGAASNDGGTPSNGDVSGNGGASSNGGTSNSGSNSSGGGASSHGVVTNNGGATSNGGTSDSGSTNAGGGTSNNEGTSSNDSGNTNAGGDKSSNGGTSDSGDTIAGGGTSSNGGVFSHNEASSSSEGSTSDAGGVSSNGAASNNGAGSTNGDGPEPEAGRSADLHGTQYVPSIVMAGDLPVSIASNAVIVGSHTVNAGAPPTTVVTNGQTIAINPSQIIAQGKTFSIQAAVTPPPATYATVGNVPVVLRPEDVAIGSKTFEHGSSPTSVVYNGQTYSWDASHLVGAGATVAFPSVDSPPRVTAGGQVFSVFPSQLKASGRNIPLPNTAKASPFVYKGQTFSVNPSQIIAPDTSITLPSPNKVTPFVYIDHSLSVDASQFMARSTTIPLSSGSGIVTYNGQVLTIRPSKIIGPSTTVALSALDDSAASLMAVTTGGLTFSIGPSAAVVGSSTYSFVPGKAPATIMTHGEAVLVGSNGVQFGNVHVPIPTITPSFSAITQGDITFSVAPSEVVVGSRTDSIHSDMIPITTIVNGHTISIGPKGVGLAGTTIPLPTPKPSFSMATEGDLTFSVAPSEVVVKGKTYSIASNKAPITTAIDGQKMTIGLKGIHLEGTTVNLPVIQTPIIVTADGLTFSVGATDAVISGTTYAIGNGAPLQTVVVGSRTIGIGSAGVMLPSTTIAPEQTLTVVTADGLTFSVDSTEAVINGETYAIGSGAVAKTIAEGSKTMILGTDGIALPSTTIRPWSSATQTDFSSILGTSSLSSAATATGPLTPIVTGKEADKKHAAGISRRVPSSSTLLGLVLGSLMLALS